MGIYVGIDLGTTYSVVAHVDKSGSPVIIPASSESVTTPSAVYIGDDGKVLIGKDAKDNQRYKELVATFYKRTIGDPEAVYYLEDGKSYNSIQLSSMFLRELIKNTEKNSGEEILGAVITVPAYFTEHEKSNTRKAAELAGINVLHMVNEPTAAAIAYGFDKADNKKILVYDLGGGTFDISVAEITKERIKIVATAGDHQLGGKEWDDIICRWMAEQFEKQFGEDFSYDSEQMDAIRIDAENLKRKLTGMDKAEVKVKYEKNAGMYTLTEQEFRNRTRKTLERTGDLIEKMFKDNNMSWADIDDVILIGGSTRMKMVEDYLAELRNGKRALRGINPDEAVAIGAALLARSLSGFELDSGECEFNIIAGEKKVEDVNSHSLGLIAAKKERRGRETYRVFYNEIMIPKNTSLESASYTKDFILNSDTQDIYLTQWEDDSLPEDKAIIGKYQVSGIIPNKPFSVTYFHKPDSTVDISAVQSGKSLKVVKVSDFSDRAFEPEQIKSARGAVAVSVDLSGSMLIGKPKTALQQTQEFIMDFINKFPLEFVSFSIVGFSDRVKVYCDLSNDIEVISNSVAELSKCGLGGGNSAHPMDEMYNILVKEKINCDFCYALVLTDGYWSKAPSDLSLEKKKDYQKSGIEIVALGFGSAKDDFIKNLATLTDLSGVGDLSSLGDSMNHIAESISSGYSLK